MWPNGKERMNRCFIIFASACTLKHTGHRRLLHDTNTVVSYSVDVIFFLNLSNPNNVHVFGTAPFWAALVSRTNCFLNLPNVAQVMHGPAIAVFCMLWWCTWSHKLCLLRGWSPLTPFLQQEVPPVLFITAFLHIAVAVVLKALACVGLGKIADKMLK